MRTRISSQSAIGLRMEVRSLGDAEHDAATATDECMALFNQDILSQRTLVLNVDVNVASPDASSATSANVVVNGNTPVRFDTVVSSGELVRPLRELWHVVTMSSLPSSSSSPPPAAIVVSHVDLLQSSQASAAKSVADTQVQQQVLDRADDAELLLESAAAAFEEETASLNMTRKRSVESDVPSFVGTGVANSDALALLGVSFDSLTNFPAPGDSTTQLLRQVSLLIFFSMDGRWITYMSLNLGGARVDPLERRQIDSLDRLVVGALATHLYTTCIAVHYSFDR
jgi:hypothetical protein